MILSGPVKLYLQGVPEIRAMALEHFYAPVLPVKTFQRGAASPAVICRDVGSILHASFSPLVDPDIEIRTVGPDFSSATRLAELVMKAMRELNNVLVGGAHLYSSTVTNGILVALEPDTEWPSTTAIYQVWAAPEGG